MLFLLSCNMSSHIPPSLCRHGHTFPITNNSSTINVVQNPSLSPIRDVRKTGTEAEKPWHFPFTTHPGCKSVSLSSSEGGSSS